MSDGIVSSNYKTGDIVIIGFSDRTDLGNRVLRDANDVWYNLPEDLAKYAGPGGFSFNGVAPEMAPVLKELQVKQLPALVFAEKIDPVGNKNWKVLQILEGDIPKPVILATYYRNIKKLYSNGDNFAAAEEELKDLGIIKTEINLNPFGIDLDLLNNITKFSLISVAIFTAYKASQAKSNVGRFGYGAVSALAVSPFLKKGNFRKYYPPD